MTDTINRPDWYYNGGKATTGPLDYADQQDLGVYEHAIVKYVTRAGRKPGSDILKDLRQAKFYLDRLIQQVEDIEDETWLNAPAGRPTFTPANEMILGGEPIPFAEQSPQTCLRCGAENILTKNAYCSDCVKEMSGKK